MSFLESLINELAAETRKAGKKASAVVDAPDFDVDDLRDEILQLRRDMARLSRTARRSGKKAMVKSVHQAEELAAETADTIKRHPGASVLALAVAGYFVVRLFKSR